MAPNPPFGAVFTYYLAEDLTSLEEARREVEKPLAKDGKDTPYPGWEALEAERREEKPAILLTVRDGDGGVVRRLTGPARASIAWRGTCATRRPMRRPGESRRATGRTNRRAVSSPLRDRTPSR